MRKKKSVVLSAAIVMAIAVVMFIPVTGIAGSLEPSAAPAPTMKTLDEIGAWSQTLSCESTSNCPRFQLVLNGAGVLDKETGLVWEQSPSTSLAPSWASAIDTCLSMSVGGRKGWRLPTIEELSSLVDPIRENPSLPAGHPFTIVLSYYFSATTRDDDATLVRGVRFDGGYVGSSSKAAAAFVWCVRGGQGYDGL